MTNTFSAGKRGTKVRSDCYIEITQKKSGGIKLALKSKVQSMYGSTIEDQIFELCRFFSLRHAHILMEDRGALPFTIAARFETVIRLMTPNETNEYLPEFNKANKYKTIKDRFRRSRLYLPGNEPKFFPNAGLHKPDGIILDLEDSVAPSAKNAAQILVRNALRAIDFYGAERMVRINQFPKGLDDLDFIVPNNVHVILIPKIESAVELVQIENRVDEIKKKNKIKNDIYFMPIIESAKGIMNAFEIVQASNNICALTIGLEDYTADIGIQRTADEGESFMARGTIVAAAKASGIQAIDTVFSDINDMEGLRKSTLKVKQLGFEGKGCIHPRQIKVVHEVFTPTNEEIKKAQQIYLAFQKALAEGTGVVTIGSKMIDAPVVKRAEATIELAIKSNILDKNWEAVLNETN